MIAALLLAVAAAVAGGTGREALGVHGGWGAFRDAVPRRCFAIARPSVAGGRAGGFASVSSWPDRRARGVLFVRLARPLDPASPVTLSIGERRFALAARDRNVWAADDASERAIVAAMRSARSMSIEGVAAGGEPFADVYALSGAATAIDAAALACAAR